MKAYRRRFVLFNMLMVGIVLTAMVAGVAVYMYQDYYDSLHDTMAQVVKPLSVLSAEASDADPADTAEADTIQVPPTADSGETAEAGVETDAPSSPAAALPPEEDVPQPPVGEQQPPQAEEPHSSSSSAPMVSAGEGAPPAGSETPQLSEEAPERNPGGARHRTGQHGGLTAHRRQSDGERHQVRAVRRQCGRPADRRQAAGSAGGAQRRIHHPAGDAAPRV